MSDAVDRGITVTEIIAVDQPIDVFPETTAAFIGRALRGPLDTPILVQHFGEFRRHFGGCWSRSSLGPAVKQFFEHGGKRLYVVRVANSARGAMVCLPAGGSALVLRAIEPGSTECLRAAVDYDGIDTDDSDHFNLTLQRLDPSSRLIIDQEIFNNLSFAEDSETFVADVLMNSTITRAEHPYPTHRPDATVDDDSRYDLKWIDPVQEGADGDELMDYDLIGSRERRTGMFALDDTEHFDLLYMPPPSNGVDPGPAAILAAELFCRRRGAMLIIDPPVDAETGAEIITTVDRLGYASPNIVSYFPRIVVRGDPDQAPRVAGGALVGLFCKLDRMYGPWADMNGDALGFNRMIKPCRLLATDERNTLVRAGINIIASGTAGRAQLVGSTTLGRGSGSHRVFTCLPVRRLCLRVINTIDQATRWAVFEQPDGKLTARIQGQVSAYLAHLVEIGALGTEHFVVQCDADIANRDDQLEHGVTILLVFHPAGSAAPVSFTLHQTVRGCRVAMTAFAPVVQNCA